MAAMNTTSSSALSAQPVRNHARGIATRDLMIRAAERLFAERGIQAVSMREIAHAAGQRNNGATQYHFATRENILVAIYVFRAAPINVRRREQLAHLQEAGRLDDVSALLRAILAPHVESLREPGNHFVGYLARVLTDEADLRIVTSEAVVEHVDALRHLEANLRVQCSGLSTKQFQVRYSTVFNWAIHALAEFQRAHPRATRASVDAMFDDLVAMLTAALGAPTADPRR